MSLPLDGALSSRGVRRDPAGAVRRSSLSHGPRPVRIRRPLAPRWSDGTLLWALGCYIAVLAGIWTVHGGAAQLSDGAAGIATALTQLTGLAASGAGLLGLVLVARPAALERRVGLDRLFVWHRILGESMAILVGLQASGKSTFYRRHLAGTHALVSKDRLRNNRRPARRPDSRPRASRSWCRGKPGIRRRKPVPSCRYC